MECLDTSPKPVVSYIYREGREGGREREREGGLVGHVTVKIQNGCLDHLRLVALRSIEKVSKPLF